MRDRNVAMGLNSTDSIPEFVENKLTTSMSERGLGAEVLIVDNSDTRQGVLPGLLQRNQGLFFIGEFVHLPVR